MPGTKLEAVFVGAPGESDLVWAVQLLDGLSMQFTQVLFKQYVRRRKDGTAATAAAPTSGCGNG